MKLRYFAIMLSILMISCFCGDLPVSAAEGQNLSQIVAQADGSNAVQVTNSRLKSDGSYANNLVVEAYVENTSDKCANDVSVSLIFKDPTGISAGDLADGKPRVYSYFTASVSQLKPHSGQWVNIPTTVANPTNKNEGAKTVTIEIWRKGDMSATPIVLQYYFMTKVASFTN
jgi:hypothetical protein